MLRFVKMSLCQHSRGPTKGQMGGSVWPLVGWATVVRLETMCGRVNPFVSFEFCPQHWTWRKPHLYEWPIQEGSQPGPLFKHHNLTRCRPINIPHSVLSQRHESSWLQAPGPSNLCLLTARIMLAHSIFHTTVIFPSLIPCTCKCMLIL